jgi:hypothetical protein
LNNKYKERQEKEYKKREKDGLADSGMQLKSKSGSGGCRE